MSSKRLTLFSLSVFIFVSVSIDCIESCAGIKNVVLTIKDSTESWSNLTVSGCIQRTIFNGKTITEIHVKNQKIPKLEKDYVRHLIKLDILEFKNCEIESIAPGAFRNLLALRIVGITHNPLLTMIEGGIFDIFDTIHILRLNNNNIATITDEALSNMTLQEVNFSYNNFSKFDPVWFAYSPYIKHIYFQNNKIQKLPPKAFDTMRELQNINFDNNRINNIGDGAFRKLKKLRTLNLKNNQLTKIIPNIFPNNLQVDSFNLAGNFLSDIPGDVLNRLSLSNICIEYNPILCSCYSDLGQYFFINNVTLIKANNCDLKSLPYCISTNTECKNYENESYKKLVKRYLEVISNLSLTEKKCADLEHYNKN